MPEPLTPEDCARRIARARRLVALTGAGVSTAAGIPDFRGPSGLYATGRYDADAVFRLDRFLDDPRPFWDFTRDFMDLLDRIAPTATHRLLARLEAAGRLRALLTQNVDPLHRQAGSRSLLAVHGSYDTGRCLACRARVSYGEMLRAARAAPVPRCACGGILKPDVVFFGEPVHAIESARREAEASDLLLVLGSSLAVFPACTIPEHAGGEVIVVNRGEVDLRETETRHFVDADLDDWSREVAAALRMDLDA
jgi:NAD-dependent deacetylase